MPRKKKVAIAKDPTQQLLDTIITSIQDKKGKNVVSIDLTGLESRVCDYFIICHGDSSTQVSAIADNVEYDVKKQVGERAWHSEGYQNSEWILIDYVNVVVHVFLNEMRDFYGLEKLWGDGVVTHHAEEVVTPKMKELKLEQEKLSTKASKASKEVAVAVEKPIKKKSIKNEIKEAVAAELEEPKVKRARAKK